MRATEYAPSASLSNRRAPLHDSLATTRTARVLNTDLLQTGHDCSYFVQPRAIFSVDAVDTGMLAIFGPKSDLDGKGMSSREVPVDCTDSHVKTSQSLKRKHSPDPETTFLAKNAPGSPAQSSSQVAMASPARPQSLLAMPF